MQTFGVGTHASKPHRGTWWTVGDRMGRLHITRTDTPLPLVGGASSAPHVFTDKMDAERVRDAMGGRFVVKAW